jgi:hypothetical protein
MATEYRNITQKVGDTPQVTMNQFVKFLTCKPDILTQLSTET